MTETRSIKGVQRRSITFQRDAIDHEARTCAIAISSEQPVERWFGIETLGHRAGEIDLSRMQDGAPLLLNHDPSDQIGVVDSVSLDADGVLRGVVRFSKSVHASEIWQDVLDGIRTKISVGYSIDDFETTAGKAGAPDQVRATCWTPYETSFVSIPADNTVGVGRSSEALATPDSVPAVSPNPATEAARHTQEVLMEPNTPAASVAALNTDAVRAAAITESLELQAAGERLGLRSETSQLLQAGATGEQVRKMFLDKVIERGGTQMGAAPGVIQLTEKENREYSICRAINAQVSGERCFEREVSDELAKRTGRTAKGILIPTNLASRAQDATVAASAKNLISTAPVTFIELLRNKLIVAQAGATFLTGLTSYVPFARQNGSGAASWLADNSTAVGVSDPSLEIFTLSPKQVLAARAYSKMLLQQATIAADHYVMDDLSKSIALAIDAACLYGTGSGANQPLGLKGQTGVGVVAGATNGLALNFANAVALETAVAVANALDGSPCKYVTNSKVRGSAKQTLVAAAAGSRMIWDNNEINGYEALASNQVASTNTKGSGTNLSDLFFGNWSELLVGEFGSLDITVDPYSLSTSGLVRVTGIQMVDAGVRHPGSFAFMNDIIA